MHGLSSRRGADVVYRLAAGEARSLRDHHGTLILHCPRAFPVSGKFLNTVSAGKFITIRKKLSLPYLYALFGHLCYDFLFALLTAPVVEANSYRTHLKQGPQQFFCLLFAKLLPPHTDDPLRHGKPAGERSCIGEIPGSRRAVRREFPCLLIPRCASQKSVHKSREFLLAILLSEFDRLVAGGGIRDRVHVQDLEDPHAQDIPYHRPYPGALFRVSPQHVVELDPALDHSFCQPFDKSPLPAVHSLALAAVQHLLHRDVAVCSVFSYPGQYFQDGFSLAQSVQSILLL